MFNQTNKSREQLEKEWKEVEELIIVFQLQFKEDYSKKDKQKVDNASIILLDKFFPLFKKYIHVLTTAQFDWNDNETKAFVSLFMNDKSLIRALNRKKQSSEFRAEVYKKFNFIKETYGSLSIDEINEDLYMAFFTLAKRYKNVGKSFCGYIYNSFKFEMARLIKKHIKNPLNMTYKNLSYEDCKNGENDLIEENELDDSFYEDMLGIPDISWTQGVSCSSLFEDLSPMQRKILIKYYLEYWSDRQIGECFGPHVNTINQHRTKAINLIADKINLVPIRNRRSGKKAILPMNNNN